MESGDDFYDTRSWAKTMVSIVSFLWDLGEKSTAKIILPDLGVGDLTREGMFYPQLF